MSSPKWSGKPKRFNPNRNFVMSDGNPARKFNPKSTFSPSFSPTLQNASLATPSGPASLSGGIDHAFSRGDGFVPGYSPSAGMGPDAASADLPGSVTPGVPNNEVMEYAALYRPPPHPLQYHVAAPTPFRLHMAPIEPHERRAEDFDIPAHIRKELAERNEATLQVMAATNLPDFVHVYHSLYPLDIGKGAKETQLWGHQAYRYKAVSHNDGRTYCLLVIDDYEITSENEHALQVINKWKRVQSASTVGVVEAFTTLAFSNKSKNNSVSQGSGSSAGSSSTNVNSAGSAQDSISLAELNVDKFGNPSALSSPKQNGAGAPGSPGKSGQCLVIVYEWWALSQPLLTLPDPNEQVLWDIAVQLFTGLQTIHRRGLVTKGLVDEKFILLQGKSRVRFGSLGVADVLQIDAPESAEQDHKDLAGVLRRLSRTIVNTSQFTEFVDALEQGNISQAQELLMPYLCRSLDHAYQSVDTLEDQLALELENGRLVRLLAKIEFVLSCREAWDPTDTRYPLALFKLYAFKQRTEDGKPSLNLAHAVAALNKLDAGTDENVLLTSEDSKTRIIVSYKDLKQMFSTAFEQMAKA